MRAIINAITTTVFVLTLLFAFLVAGIRLFGLDPYTVLSGSMEPAYHVGSVVYVWTGADPLKLEVGDPVTFMLNETTVIKILENLAGGNSIKQAIRHLQR